VAIMESALSDELTERSGGDQYLTVVHVDAETLADDADGRCQIEDGPAIAPETARRLACDTGLVAMLDDPAGNPLVVGKKTRTVPTALRRAVHARDEHCKFPGCDRPIAHVHHIEFWAQGGPTVLTNLIGLCKFHHRCVHEGGYTVEVAEDGTVLFYRPDGQVIDPAPKARIDPDDGGIEQRNRDHGLDITATTVTTNWSGDTLDLSLATDNIMWDRRRAQNSTSTPPKNPPTKSGRHRRPDRRNGFPGRQGRMPRYERGATGPAARAEARRSASSSALRSSRGSMTAS